MYIVRSVRTCDGLNTYTVGENCDSIEEHATASTWQTWFYDVRVGNTVFRLFNVAQAKLVLRKQGEPKSEFGVYNPTEYKEYSYKYMKEAREK